MGLNRNLGQLTAVLTESNGNVLLNPNNTVGGTNVYIGQTMATNDTWRIYGNTIASDRGEIVFELGDNASSHLTNGQRFRFYYNNIASGTAKSPFILDYNDAIFNTSATFSGNIQIQDNSILNLGYNHDGGATLKYNSNGNLDITPRAGYNSVFTAGNVGIGTATFVYSPKIAINSVGQNTLAIQTTDSIQGSTGTVLYVGTGATTGNTYGIIRALGDGGTGNANLVLQPSGNVLIGTTIDTGNKLQVAGPIQSQNFGRKIITLNLTPQSLGLPINGYSGGSAYLLLISTQFDAGNGTGAALWMIRCGYNGNNFEATQISVSNTASGISFSQVNGVLYIAGNTNWVANIQIISNNILF